MPLGDLVEWRALIVLQFAFLAAALAFAALAPGPSLPLLASLLVALSATVAQQIVHLAAHLSSPEKRSATVGMVLAGILSGILLSRTLSGFVATGWLAVSALGGILAAVATGLQITQNRK